MDYYGTKIKSLKKQEKEKPYHLHYTSDINGGGNWENVARNIQNCCDKNRLSMTYVFNECHSVGVEDFAKYYVIGRYEIHYVIERAFIISQHLSEQVDDISEVLDEVNHWRILPSSMALHPRLGKESALGLVGADVLNIIMNFMRN